MLTLSLWQPHASLVATQAKRFETRSWRTRYRGRLLIHAAKGGLSKTELIHQLSLWSIQGGLAPLKGQPLDLKGHSWPGVNTSDLPFGCVVCMVRLVDIFKTDDMTQAQIGLDRPFGDFSLGRYAWLFKDVMPCLVPMPWPGRQGLFDIPDREVLRWEFVDHQTAFKLKPVHLPAGGER